ncbi:hypothetical protein Vretimale_16254 [Volvox reticuliferus]|uniref:Uncharacterized protein n=1 Tax=Volvox reticuliferus TaxID=1737510 RepID=A0A8J4GTV5_9CHLO|nr:hypothetical protein Vretifemale_16455 [Volvox reticuliferus]GIM13117.1 hypothetical protein Vretimale_16254 [Volvox reticuliferus]
MLRLVHFQYHGAEPLTNKMIPCSGGVADTIRQQSSESCIAMGPIVCLQVLTSIEPAASHIVLPVACASTVHTPAERSGRAMYCNSPMRRAVAAPTTTQLATHNE